MTEQFTWPAGVNPLNLPPGALDPNAHTVHYRPDPPPAGPPPAPQLPAEVAQEQATAAADQDAAMPQSVPLTLKYGARVLVRPLMTIELLNLINIALSGIAAAVFGSVLNTDDEPDVFGAEFFSLLVSAALDDPRRTVKFLRSVVEPAEKVTGFRIDKETRAANAELDAALDEIMKNPHPDDMISILEVIKDRDGGDLYSWGKRIAGMWNLAKRAGRIPAFPTSPASTSSAVSA